MRNNLFFILFFLLPFLGNAQENYVPPLSKNEIEKNYNAINRLGVINSVSEVPNTKVEANKNVSDPHNMLPASAEDQIQSLTDQIHSEKDYEIMVVALHSISSEDPRGWGTELFNHWGIGDRETENGLLILVINNIRRVEFITGRGMESVLTDGESYQIQQDYMIPHFKKNDYVTGIIHGVQATIDVLNGKQILYDDNPDDLVSEEDREVTFTDSTYFIHPALLYYFIFCGILALIYFIFLLFAISTKDLYKRYRTMKFWSLWIFAFIAPIPFAFLVYFTRKSMHKWRNMDRVGFQSGELLHKLSEEEEDVHLSKGQVTEEIVNSVDYDVWINDAGTDIVILAYRRWFSPYDKCSKCKYRTYLKLYDKVITSATYSRSGQGEKKYKCKNCGHEKITRYRIPKKQRSSSGSTGGGYFSGGSSSGGSFGGGGGSFGGSFGGGGSRGGGAGSSW